MISTSVDTALSSQQQIWLNTAKHKLKTNTIRRLDGRIVRLEFLINVGINSKDTKFIVDETLKEKIYPGILNTINAFQSTKILSQCKSQDEVMRKARTWWHRGKATTLGSQLFVVICFYLLHTFIQSHCQSLSTCGKLLLFIDILEAFVMNTITFPKTKPKPLILQQCYSHNGSFKSICLGFVNTFGDESIRWDCYIKKYSTLIENGKRKSIYIRQKDRAQVLQNTFCECLKKIKAKWLLPDANKNIDHVMKQWQIIVNKFKPAGYDIYFESNNESPNVLRSESLGLSSTQLCNQRWREFQGMNGFGESFNHNVNKKQSINEKASRSLRQEHYIQTLRDSQSNIQDNTDTDFNSRLPYLEP